MSASRLGGKRMDSFSRSNRKRQGAFLLQGVERPSARVGNSPCDCCRKDADQPLPSFNDLYLIGRAYSEPQCCNHIENFLLQRNFIID